MVNDWVTVWSDESLPVQGTQANYISGVFTPDFWSPSFQPLSESTYERIAEHNGGWVAVSSVWSYGTIKPLPTIESRALISDSVRTPLPDIVEQTRKAHAAGLKVLLSPQFNMEMSPGGIDALSDLTEEWWNAWLDLAEEMWMWDAILAEEVEAEVLLLPGFVFHVFANPDFPSQAAFDAFDARLLELIDQVRAVYGGQLLMSGGVLESDAPGAVDLVGVTTFDTGTPSVSIGASAQEWHEAYDALFIERLDPIWERWGKPVLLYTINIDAMDEVLQATQLDGIMRAVTDRPWLAGSFMWNYDMVDAPLNNGLRDRLGEAVMARHYGAFTGKE